MSRIGYIKYTWRSFSDESMWHYLKLYEKLGSCVKYVSLAISFQLSQTLENPYTKPKYSHRRLRPMALGVVRFRLRTRPPIHVVHRRRWLRIRIDVQRFNVDRFVRVRVMWRSVMAARWGPVSRMVPRMTRRRSQAYTTGCCVRVRPQGIHVARFTTDLQLVLDEGIVWSRRVRRRMVRCSLEGTPTKWPTTRRTCTTGRWSPGGTTTALAIVTVVGTSGSGTRFRT